MMGGTGLSTKKVRETEEDETMQVFDLTEPAALSRLVVQMFQAGGAKSDIPCIFVSQY